TQKPPAAHEDPLAYVARYDGGPCFAILSATASAGSARIEAVGALREAFETLNEAFRNAFGFEAEIKAALATRAQCAAIDFFRAAADGRDFAPKIELASAFPHAGAPLTGSVTSPAGRALAAVFVDPAGLAQGAETPPASGRGRAFSLTPPRAKESAELQLLLLVSSAAPLAALRPGRPAPAEAMLSAARAEAEARGDRLGVGLAYFYVTD
ncbi:hypothetical protein, partial [Methylocella sp.]|uniref:hypothetical protein n=1 Tax=Methylocella sp. TaxID=1978226 RepID=UPI003784A87A